MRILLVSDDYPPYIGGAQIQTQLLARKLQERGHEVMVATTWQNDLPGSEVDHGISVHRLRQLRTLPGIARKRWQHYQPPFADPVTAISLRGLVKRFKPDIVHSYGWISYSAAAALLGMDVPLLITARDYAYSCANRTLIRDGQDCSGPALGKCIACAGRQYGRSKGTVAALSVWAGGPLLKRKISGVHSVSNYVRDMVRRDFLDDRTSKHEGASRNSGLVIHDVIGSMPSSDPTGGEATRPAPAGLPAEPFMLFIGALRQVKGIDELLTAYQRLSERPLLVLIGTMEPDSPTEFPPGVHVLLDVPHRDVMDAADSEFCLFGVMPSLWPEPFGTVVCEVMSHSKPVIGTTPGGHADMIINGETGYLVPRGDVDALVKAMETLISDSELRTRMGKAAQERARQFTAEVSIPRLERLYEQIVAQQHQVA